MGKTSQVVEGIVNKGKMSKLAFAYEQMADLIDGGDIKTLPSVDILVKVRSTKITNRDLDIEFTVPFDDDMEANEAEIVIYNLTQNTISHFKHDEKISITVGYTGDTGIIFEGRISKVKTKRVGNDKQTTIYAIDSQSLKERNIKSIAYKKNVTASYILKDLIGKTNLSIAKFVTKRDYTYKDSVTVNGGLMDNIKKYAEVCGVSAYINKGKVYVQHIKDGENINFTLSADTGLIGSPEEFEEDVTSEKFKDVIKGYNVKLLLQHRITTGAIVKLKSEYIKGVFRVRSGMHSYDGTNFTTEVSVI